MNCCSRKTPSSATRSLNPRQSEVPIQSFEKLVESLQIDLKSTEELKKLKEEFLNRAEWTTAGRNRMSNLNEEFSKLSQTLLEQIDHLARGLKTQLIINTKIEDELSKELKSTR